MSTNSGHLVVVLGMHRSGTSAVSRSLKVMGVELGESLMPAHADINAKGFWEDTDFVKLNIEIGQKLQRAWHFVAPISDEDLSLLHETDLVDKAKALIAKRLDEYKVFGLKDPRIANLASFWMPIFKDSGARVSAVLSIRHPASVARSLAKRDGFTNEHSYLSWIDHVLTSLKASSGVNRVLVNYDMLMDSPTDQLQRMSRRLDMPLIDAELKSYQEEFLDNDLRHTAFDLSDLDSDPTCPAIVRDCYALLLDASKDKVDIQSEEFASQIALWCREHERNRPMLALLDERWNDAQTLGRQLDTHRAKITELHHSVGQQKSLLTQEQSRHEAAQKRFEAEQRSFQAEQARSSATISKLQSESTNLESARSALESRTHDLVDQVSRHKSQISALRDENGRLTHTLNSKERELINFRNSTSWRITAPIRWLRELIRGGKA